VQFFESFPGKKNSPQSEFRAKSYARFKEDPPNYVLLVVESESESKLVELVGKMNEKTTL
jgi:hypothetical protein